MLNRRGYMFWEILQILHLGDGKNYANCKEYIEWYHID